MTPQQQLELEAAAFRRLVDHLRQRTDVQNIDLMNLAGFCRNCLSRWMAEAAAEAGVPLGKEEAKTLVYGMPYADWVAKNQTAADAAKRIDGQKQLHNLGPWMPARDTRRHPARCLLPADPGFAAPPASMERGKDPATAGACCGAGWRHVSRPDRVRAP